ncbi:Hypothetical predicted protein [Pelobates cultripes]|uniref:Uncharacterized protein n=1 Tax=Pelobates cultripes TaxID=61616 RepID=A0AAD1VUH0_PELCU|nr:Hypothetical predicted protein [Pelobates cultripes]
MTAERSLTAVPSHSHQYELRDWTYHGRHSPMSYHCGIFKVCNCSMYLPIDKAELHRRNASWTKHYHLSILILLF